MLYALLYSFFIVILVSVDERPTLIALHRVSLICADRRSEMNSSLFCTYSSGNNSMGHCGREDEFRSSHTPVIGRMENQDLPQRRCGPQLVPFENTITKWTNSLPFVRYTCLWENVKLRLLLSFCLGETEIYITIILFIIDY